jgi:integrase
LIYTASEMLRLIEAARLHRPDFVGSLVIGAFAGLRSSEIERLTWQDISKTFITASAKKRGTPSRRLVPIQPNLSDWLTAHAFKTGKVWRGTHDGFSDAQQEIAKAAGVTWKANGLRHSFISCRLAVVQDVAKVALEAGNSVATIHKSYRELVTPKDGKAWFSIRPTAPENVLAMQEVSNG